MRMARITSAAVDRRSLNAAAVRSFRRAKTPSNATKAIAEQQCSRSAKPRQAFRTRCGWLAISAVPWLGPPFLGASTSSVPPYGHGDSLLRRWRRIQLLLYSIASKPLICALARNARSGTVPEGLLRLLSIAELGIKGAINNARWYLTVSDVC